MHRGHPRSSVTYDFLFKFNRNYEAMSYRFRDIIAYFPKIKEVT